MRHYPQWDSRSRADDRLKATAHQARERPRFPKGTMPQEFVWLLELAGRTTLYLHGARGPGVIGFTDDPYDAQRFATRADAEAERVALDGALGAQPVEHGFA